MADWDFAAVPNPALGFISFSFQLVANGSFIGNVSLDDNGAGGSFDSGSYFLDAGSQPTVTVTYFPSSGFAGDVVFSGTNDAAGVDPEPIDVLIYVPGDGIDVSLSSHSAQVGVSVITATLTPTYSGGTSPVCFMAVHTAIITVTETSAGKTQTVQIAASFNDLDTSATLEYRPGTAGSHNVAYTSNNPNLPPDDTVTVTAAPAVAAYSPLRSPIIALAA
jgi:hypothetical protein